MRKQTTGLERMYYLSEKGVFHYPKKPVSRVLVNFCSTVNRQLQAGFKFKPWHETSYYAFAICIKGFISVFKLNKNGGLGPGKKKNKD
jgi:hypothetical protein